MKKFFLFISIGLGLFFFRVRTVQGRVVPIAGSSAKLSSQSYGPNRLDYRQLRLYYFLKAKKSPLISFSNDFIQAADFWGIDWRLLPAIAGLESSFGKRLILGSYNAYGWGGGYIRFSGWQDSIYHVSQKLRENYYNRGLTSPAAIGKVYAPPNPRWGNLISSIMNKI